MRENIKISVKNLYTHAMFCIIKGSEGEVLYAPGQSALTHVTCLSTCVTHKPIPKHTTALKHLFIKIQSDCINLF